MAQFEALEKKAPGTVLTAVGLVMRRPISVCVLVFALAMASFLALQRMQRDILPDLGIPVIYVAQPYGRLDAGQMESYLTYFYEYHFLYISGN